MRFIFLFFGIKNKNSPGIKMFAKECSRTHCQSRLEEGIERLSSKLFYPYNRKSFPKPQEIPYNEFFAVITKNCAKLTRKIDS